MAGLNVLANKIDNSEFVPPDVATRLHLMDFYQAFAHNAVNGGGGSRFDYLNGERILDVEKVARLKDGLSVAIVELLDLNEGDNDSGTVVSGVWALVDEVFGTEGDAR